MYKMRSAYFKMLAIFIALLLTCGCQTEKNTRDNTTPIHTDNVTDNGHSPDATSTPEKEEEGIRVTEEEALKYMAEKFEGYEGLDIEYNSETKRYELSWTNPGGGMGWNGEIDAITGDVYTWPDELIGNVYEKETNAFTDGSYEGYLKSLPPDNFKSVGKACEEFKRRASDDKSINDKMFKEFYDFHKNVHNQIYDYHGKIKEGDEPYLKENGFKTMEFAEGIYVFCEPGYLKDNFLDYVSDSIREFILTDYTNSMLNDGGDIISDALLCIERDALSDIIIEWENYIKKYSEPDWTVDIAKGRINLFLLMYTEVELMSSSDLAEKTRREDDILRSYKRFIEKYPDSDYHQFIKEYYEILKTDGVKKTEKTVNLLEKYDLL